MMPKGAIGPADLSAGQLADALDDRLAVRLPVLKDRQHDRHAGGGDEFLAELRAGMMHNAAMYVEGRSDASARFDRGYARKLRFSTSCPTQPSVARRSAFSWPFRSLPWVVRRGTPP